MATQQQRQEGSTFLSSPLPGLTPGNGSRFNQEGTLQPAGLRRARPLANTPRPPSNHNQPQTITANGRNNGDPSNASVESSSSNANLQQPLIRPQQSHNMRSQCVRGRGHVIGNQLRNPPYVRPPNQHPQISPPPTSEIGQVLTLCKMMDSRLKRLEAQTSEIKTSMESVTALIEKHLQSSFQIKGGIYETALKIECAKLFCLDVRREVPVDKIQPVITKVLRHDAKDKFKFTQALSFCQKKMNSFRSDEKRKVLGFDPYPTQKSLSTLELVDVSLKSMNAPPEVRAQYQKNLAILTKFVREENPRSDKFHRNFRLWLDRNPALDEAAVVEEDKNIDYSHSAATESDEREANMDGDSIGGHYIDPLYEYAGYSPASVQGDHDALNDDQHWDAQHGEAVASLLDNNC